MMLERYYGVQTMEWLVQVVDYTGQYIPVMDMLLPCYVCSKFRKAPNMIITICNDALSDDYVTVAGECNRIVLPQSPLGYVCGYLLSQMFLDLLSHIKNRCALHCAVLVQKQSAILVVGKSHSGKSYFCKEAIIHSDVDCLSDDFAILKYGEHSILTENIFKPVYLRQDAVDDIECLERYFKTMRCNFPEEDKLVLFNHKLLMEDSFEVSRVVFLSRREKVSPSLRSLTTNEAYEKLLHNMLSKNLALNRQCISKICNTIECVSCVYSEANDVLEMILNK